LPQEYRHFLTEIGNGGAGPFYGLFPWGKWDGAGRELVTWQGGDGKCPAWVEGGTRPTDTGVYLTPPARACWEMKSPPAFRRWAGW
jgi:hypothetical protein